jgi:multisubunit Na+/H+ antiporter MnhE subunit
MKTTVALLLLIVAEMVILAVGIVFHQSFLIAIAIAGLVVGAIVLFVTSDYFQDRWEPLRRDRDH